MDMLELFPGALRLRPKPFVLLLDRVGLYPQPIVLVQDSVDGGRVILDCLDPSERVTQRCERLGQWRVRWEGEGRGGVEAGVFGGFRAGADARSGAMRG